MDRKTVVRAMKVMLAMVFTALGLAFMATSNLGMNPWWTFTTSISLRTGLTLGLVVQVLSLCMILIARLMGIKPGIATILDMLLIGFYIDWIQKIPFFTMQHSLAMQILLSIVGLLLFCIGIFFTIRIGLGAGPKESLTFAIVNKSKKSYKHVKFIFEISTLIIGAALGAPFGIGTVFAAIFTGWILQFMFNWDQKKHPQRVYA